MSRPMAWMVMAFLLLLGFGLAVGALANLRVLRQGNVPIRPAANLPEGVVRIQGKVRAAKPLTAPLTGWPVALVRTEIEVRHEKRTAGRWGTNVGYRENRLDSFEVVDPSGSVRVHLAGLSEEHLLLEATAAQREVTQTGRQMTPEGKRAIEALRPPAEAAGLLGSEREVRIRETALALDQEVLIQGFHQPAGPESGIRGSASTPLLIADAGSDPAGGLAGKLALQLIVLGVCAGLGVHVGKQLRKNS